MTLFKPSSAVVQKIAKVSPSFAWEMRARTRMEHPREETEIDWELAQSVLGEQIVGRIAMVARDVACARPGSKILFADSSGHIHSAWGRSFFAYLQLASKTTAAQEIRGALAKELTGWVKKHSPDAAILGLSLEGKGRLYLLCERLEPVLDPLPD